MSVVAEADDDRLRVEVVQRLEHDVHAFVEEELAEVDDGRFRLGEELGEALGVAGIRQALVRVAGVRRIAARLVEQRRECAGTRLGHELVSVDAGRHFVHAVDVTDDVFQHVPDVLRADEDSLSARERFASPRRELVVAAHRVLQLGAVRFDRVARTRRGGDRPAEQDVVREHEVGRQVLAQSCGVQLDIALTLGSREVLQQLRLEPFVTVEDEGGQDAADVRPHDLSTAEVVELGMRLLAEDDDLVPCPAPLPRQCPRIDVGARPPE